MFFLFFLFFSIVHLQSACPGDCPFTALRNPQGKTAEDLSSFHSFDGEYNSSFQGLNPPSQEVPAVAKLSETGQVTGVILPSFSPPTKKQAEYGRSVHQRSKAAGQRNGKRRGLLAHVKQLCILQCSVQSALKQQNCHSFKDHVQRESLGFVPCIFGPSTSLPPQQLLFISSHFGSSKDSLFITPFPNKRALSAIFPMAGVVPFRKAAHAFHTIGAISMTPCAVCTRKSHKLAT